VAGTLTLGACQKNGASPSRADLLTAHPWRLVALSSLASGKVTDLYATLAPCVRDNTLLFSSGTSNSVFQPLITDEGATKCTATDPQQQVGIWQFAENETRLTGSVPQLPYMLGSTLTIQELSSATLRLRFQNNNSPDYADLTFSAN
jgi:hypothetical protein